MLELLGLAATATATVLGHLKSRDFVSRKLRFVSAVQAPGAAIIAGAGASVAAAPLVALLPIVGTGTALLFGLGVGTGVAAGARRLRDGRPLLP